MRRIEIWSVAVYAGKTPLDHSNLWKTSWCVSLRGAKGSPRNGLQWLRYLEKDVLAERKLSEAIVDPGKGMSRRTRAGILGLLRTQSAPVNRNHFPSWK